MGGKKSTGRMKLKPFIEMELERLEKQLGTGYINDGYIRGKRDAIRWVLSKEES